MARAPGRWLRARGVALPAEMTRSAGPTCPAEMMRAAGPTCPAGAAESWGVFPLGVIVPEVIAPGVTVLRAAVLGTTALSPTCVRTPGAMALSAACVWPRFACSWFD